jgi:cell division protein FtsB
MASKPPMKTKVQPTARGARGRFRIFLVFLGCFIIWGGLTWLEQHQSLEEKKAEKLQIEQKIQEVQQENQQLNETSQRLQDDEYIEQKVRKDFGMARPGDKVFQPASD